MSTSTLSLKWRVAGVLTDVTSVTLADPTAAYGVKRTDTGAIVVASGAAMTHAGTGIYTYAVTDPAAGLVYSWYAKITDTDGEIIYLPFTTSGTSTHYGSLPGVVNLLGSANESTDADVNNDGNAATIAAQEEAALTEADRKINAYLLGEGIAEPATDVAGMLAYAANRYAAVALSRMRGLPVGANGNPVDTYGAYIMEADAMMEKYAAYVNFPASAANPTGPESGYIGYSNRTEVLLNAW